VDNALDAVLILSVLDRFIMKKMPQVSMRSKNRRFIWAICAVQW